MFRDHRPLVMLRKEPTVSREEFTIQLFQAILVRVGQVPTKVGASAAEPVAVDQRWVIAILKKINYQLHYQLLLY